MKRGQLVIWVIIAIIIVAVIILVLSLGKSPGIESVNKEAGTSSETNNVIEIFSSGFSPQVLEISVGESAAFINRQTGKSWPASDVHPTHTSYPGSGISKCGTSEETRIFDACGGLEQDEIYEFTFNEVGEWGYHDHLDPGKTGTIIAIQ